MSPTMIRKLQRNRDYHAAVADFYKQQDDAEKKAAADAAAATTTTRATRATAAAAATDAPAEPPKPEQSSAAKLAEMHADVVAQIEGVLATASGPPAIHAAMAERQIRRNASPELKPSAGRFH